jgi:hypothetical protein
MSSQQTQARTGHLGLKEMYKNCVKIQFNREDNITRAQIVKTLQLLKKIEALEKVIQFKNKNTWLLKYNDQYDISTMINEEHSVNNVKIKFESPFEESETHTFKISWLPPGISTSYVVEKLCSKVGKLISTKEIMYEEEGLKFGTGIFNVTIKYPKDHGVDLTQLTGVRAIFGQKVFVTRYGEGVRCLFCNEFGHIKMACPKYSLICPTCNKRGHSVCTQATKLVANIIGEEHDDDVDILQQQATFGSGTQAPQAIVESRSKPSSNQNSERGASGYNPTAVESGKAASRQTVVTGASSSSASGETVVQTLSKQKQQEQNASEGKLEEKQRN